MKKIAQCYNKFEEYLLVGSLVFTVAIIFIQVIMRYVFNSSLSWSEELARYIFMWQIWMGASLGLKERKHIKVELLLGLFEKKGKRNIEIISSLIFFAFCVFLVINGTKLTLDLVGTHALSAAMRIPLSIVYLALPFSALEMVIRILYQLYEDIVLQSKAKGGKV